MTVLLLLVRHTDDYLNFFGTVHLNFPVTVIAPQISCYLKHIQLLLAKLLLLGTSSAFKILVVQKYGFSAPTLSMVKPKRSGMIMEITRILVTTILLL